MASRNVNKIKPWMLTKNTNEIVNSYVQNIYKQMPMSFNKGLKTCKVAAFRPENRGPLSTWKNQQKQLPSTTITPGQAVAKKSSSKTKQHTNNVMNFFKSSKSNQRFSTNSASNNQTPSKRLLKTPNYKIYKSLRYGSSCSSSRSTIFKRHDERKRLKQSNLAQINYLIRSFHTSKFEPTYARFLMPARNQQLERNLGSIPDAIKFSKNMLQDLMTVDRSTRNKISQQAKTTVNTNPSKRLSLEKWHHPPSLSKYRIRTPKESAIKATKSIMERNKRPAVGLSPEHRDYARLHVPQISQMRHVKPSNELFTPHHDRQNTELHEKHRRNRMKKLGLIKSPTASEKSMEDTDHNLNAIMIKSGKRNEETNPQNSQIMPEMLVGKKKVAKLGNQRDSQALPALLIESDDSVIEDNSSKTNKPIFATKAERQPLLPAKETLKPVKTSCIPLATKSNGIKAASSKYSNYISSSTLPISYTTISPIVALRAQMPNKADLGSYRYHRHDFFSTNKY